MWIDRSVKIDSALSDFQGFLNRHKRVVQHDFLGAKVDSETEQQKPYFMIVTLSDLTNILKKYEVSGRSSNDFYHRLMDDGALTFVDINKIWTILRGNYRQKAGDSIKSELTLNLETDIIPLGNVYIGVVSSDELRRLYYDDNYGESLFFENIRTFIEPIRREGRKEPNEAIIETVQQHPEKMLEKIMV